MLIEPTDAGLYCAAGGFHIDPWQPVARAVITHAHGDHLRHGSAAYLCSSESASIVRERLGADAHVTPLDYGKEVILDGVRVSLHPAGHILGSAQVLLEYKGQRIVVTGDYKRLEDRTAQPFELVKCDLLVTEATFGLPVFQHPKPADEIARLLRSVAAFPERAHVIGCYALGKAQRVISLLRQSGYDAPIYLHGAMIRLCALYEERGIALGELRPSLDVPKGELAGQIVIAPPSAIKDRWSRRLPDPVLAVASGWMSVKQRARQSGVELPLVISDHADWNELRETITETGAQTIWVTHGREDALVYWSQQQGLAAEPLRIEAYEDSAEEGE